MQTQSMYLKRGWLHALTLACLLSCGTNVFKSADKSDPAQDATLDLEQNNPSAAITTLTAALVGDPGNAEYLSILATAYAQRAGIDPLKMALSLASGSTSTSLALAGTLSNITSLFSLVPTASTQVLSDIDKAVSILNTEISPSERQPGDIFKTAIYMTASMVLHTKALDVLGTGTLTISEISSLSDAEADAILSNLSTAQGLLAEEGASAGASASTTAAATAALTKYSSAIAAEPGATPAAQLRNYLTANPGAASSVQTSISSGTSSGT